MRIWIDADACPLPVKIIVFRASQRVGVPVTLVANQRLQTPPSPLITAVQVSQGFDEADHYLVEQATASDLVITADIPLAARLVAKGVPALNPRGELYTADNIQAVSYTHLDVYKRQRVYFPETGSRKAFGEAKCLSCGLKLL